MALEIDRASREPFLAPPPKPVETPTPPPRDPLLIAGHPRSADLADVDQALRPLVELCASDQAETPFRVGLIGGPGSEKRVALARLVEALADLGARNPGGGATRPREMIVATLDAAGLLGDGPFDPAGALAAAVFAALETGREGANYAALAEEAAHGAGDPRRAAAAAAEQQDEIARRLEGERAAREDLVAKRARLGEALIYDTPGSRVDAMIRSSRATIEARLRRFGYGGDDMAQTFRDLLYDHAGAGAGSAVGLFLRSTWAFRGQFSLLLLAVVALMAAFGLDRLEIAVDAGLVDGLGSGFAQVSKFLVENQQWLKRGVSALIAVAALAGFVNLWRATGFSALLIRGLRILNLDVKERRAELDTTLARLERRIATLTAEAEAAAQRAEQLLKRAGGAAPVARGPGPAFLKALQTPAKAARDFFAELGRLMREPVGAPRPKRIVLAIDNLDALSPERARGLIDALGALIAPGMAALVACDPGRLAACESFDLVFNLDALGARDKARLATQILIEGGRAAPAPAAAAAKIAEPLTGAETALLVGVAPLVDGAPAAVKRLYNAYRMARSADAPRPLIAVMMAALTSSRADYARAIEAALSADGKRFEAPQEPANLRDAFAAARGASDGPFDLAAARAAFQAARLWTP